MITPEELYEEDGLEDGFENPYLDNENIADDFDFYEDGFYDSDDHKQFEKPKEEQFDYEFEDESLNDIDFSEFNGDFTSSLNGIGKKLKKTKPKVKRKLKPAKGPKRTIPVHKSAIMKGKTRKTTEKILVPRDRKVIIQGVDKFMLSKSKDACSYKNIGYYKGKKLRELVFVFNNNSSNDFTLELFNPSSMLDWVFNSSQNLNNKITIAGGVAASYSDVIFHLLANPAMMPSARIFMAGNSVISQRNQNLGFKNRNIEGKQFVNPLSVGLEFDAYQFQSTVVSFDINCSLDRPFIPDGMDVVEYTVLAGMTVTMVFYYKQFSLKRFAFKEARMSKKILPG
ncbi:MAG: hypothetical protein V4547_17845 [Bacteroidota bacterium]